jgi:1-phosphatidylinositol-3-phosphate 5-kinase
MDSAYDVFDTPESEAPSTPRPHDRSSVAFPSIAPSLPNSPADGVDPPPQDSYFTTQSSTSTNTQTSQTPTVPPKNTDDSRKLLAALRHNFQKIEQLLYTQLAKTSEGSLNDVRRAFLATAEGTKKRLQAWKKKHLSAAKAKLVGDLVADEPPWWDKRCHAVPGGNIIVREDDWGSIIAHTLR